MITWLHCHKLGNATPLIQHIKLQWDHMLLNSCQNNTHYKKKQRAMEKINTAGEPCVKAQYMNCIQDNIKWYDEKSLQQNNIIFSTKKLYNYAWMS